MDTIVRLYTPITGHASPDGTIDAVDYKNNAIALRPAAAGGSFAWAIHILSAQRRQALRALYAFCREVADIADGEASHALKETLLGNWRGEVAHLYGGRPRNAVTLGVSQAVHLYGLRCQDFLAIIDGAEMKAQTDIRARLASRSWAIASVGRSLSPGYPYASSATKHRRASASRQNSAVRCSSPIYFAISPRMQRNTGSICLASYCTRTGFSQPRRVGCWRSRRLPTCAAISP
jgi:hypothetical protein